MPRDAAEQGPPSQEAERWLRTAEDPSKDVHERIKAVEQLERLKERATAARLIKLLPESDGAFTFRIIEALGAIKSPEALPALKKIYNDQETEVPGKIRVALAGAIRACGGDPNAP